MRLELIPVIIGIAIGLLGLGLVFDAWTPDQSVVRRERRRSRRVERSRAGEAWIGFGTLAMAVAFIGRDTWPYTVVSVIAGAAMVFIGVVMNRHYFGARVSHRGALRRRG
jgi:hypothetical protein